MKQGDYILWQKQGSTSLCSVKVLGIDHHQVRLQYLTGGYGSKTTFSYLGTQVVLNRATLIRKFKDETISLWKLDL